MNKEEREKLRKEINSHKLYISPLEFIDRDVLLGLLERVDVLEQHIEQIVQKLRPGHIGNDNTFVAKNYSIENLISELKAIASDPEVK